MATKHVHIPKLFTVLKWTFLIVIAVSTALMGFLQSLLVAWLYKFRSNIVINIVVRSVTVGTDLYIAPG